MTANLALQENRNVLAVPGNIDQPLSAGCNELISAGAKPVLTPQDILEEFTI
ncbi:DNA-processing protein DprA [Secundilactobacillus oryzae]|uniref:DNA-processing protein DprA n=1 Tax=Secundilactobacillus oryzae TaxID=1202668 RepID=UPI0034E19947